MPMARFVSFVGLAVPPLLLGGCGSAIFGGGGVGSFTFDEKPYFDGCSFDESQGVSSWNCSDATQKRIVEFRTCGQGHEAAFDALLTAHPERGPVSNRRNVDIHFVDGGKDVKTQASMFQQKGKLTLVASGPAPETTGPFRTPFYVACTIDANEQVEGSEMVDVAVGVATCTKRVKAVLGVVTRYHP
jgi:hypothetical protein